MARDNKRPHPEPPHRIIASRRCCGQFSEDGFLSPMHAKFCDTGVKVNEKLATRERRQN